jgi:hypothetical protein
VKRGLPGGSLLAVAAGAGAAGATGLTRHLGLRFRNGVPGDAEPHNRWLAVTVNCPPSRFADGGLPEPIARLTDQAEVRVRPAPGGRGTELAMRLLTPPRAGVSGLTARLSGHDPRQTVRAALRDAKSLIETGEVIEPDEPTTHPTLTGKMMDFATGLASGEGRL